MLDAASLLRDEKDVRFAIVGEGASKESLKTRVVADGLENVEFLPYQPKATLSESLGAADVHLVTLKRGLAAVSPAQQGLRTSLPAGRSSPRSSQTASPR